MYSEKKKEKSFVIQTGHRTSTCITMHMCADTQPCIETQTQTHKHKLPYRHKNQTQTYKHKYTYTYKVYKDMTILVNYKKVHQLSSTTINLYHNCKQASAVQYHSGKLVPLLFIFIFYLLTRTASDATFASFFSTAGF